MVVEARAKARLYGQRPGGTLINGSRCGTGPWWVGRTWSAVAPCAAHCVSAPPPRRSACRSVDNRSRLTAERLQAVPSTLRRPAKWVFDSAPPPAHIAERAVVPTEVRPRRMASPDGVPQSACITLSLRGPVRWWPLPLPSGPRAQCCVSSEPPGSTARGAYAGATAEGRSARGCAGRRCPNPALPPHQCSVRTGTAGQRPGSGHARTVRRPRGSTRQPASWCPCHRPVQC